MNLTLDRAALVSVMARAMRVAETRNTIPILSHVRLVAKDGKLTITATDLDIEIALSIPAEIRAPGATTLDARHLHDIARKLPEKASLSLEAGGSDTIILRAGKARFNLRTLPAEDFPDMARGEMAAPLVIHGADLARLLARVRFAVSTEETRHYLNGCYLHATATGLRAVATDGHRLAQCDLPMDAPPAMAGVIVPRKACENIARLCEGMSAPVNLRVSATRIALDFDGVAFVSKLVDGTFPDYERVVPKSNPLRATLDRESLKSALDLVSSIAGEKGGAVKWSLEPGKLTLAVRNPDAGDGREDMEADYAAAPIDIGFNARYARDMLDAFDGDTLTTQLADAGSPAVFTGAGDAGFLCVLMPMRV